MFLKELITQGWQALMRDRTRTALTMLGIGWGLVSVVLLLAYGQGLGGCVLHAFLNMGNNVIVLWPGQTSMQAGGQRAGKKVNYELEDVEALRDEVPLIRAVSGEIDRDLGFKIGTASYRSWCAAWICLTAKCASSIWPKAATSTKATSPITAAS